jgi:hypothetical protein
MAVAAGVPRMFKGSRRITTRLTPRPALPCPGACYRKHASRVGVAL